MLRYWPATYVDDDDGCVFIRSCIDILASLWASGSTFLTCITIAKIAFNSMQHSVSIDFISYWMSNQYSSALALCCDTSATFLTIYCPGWYAIPYTRYDVQCVEVNSRCWTGFFFCIWIPKTKARRYEPPLYKSTTLILKRSITQNQREHYWIIDPSHHIVHGWDVSGLTKINDSSTNPTYPIQHHATHVDSISLYTAYKQERCLFTWFHGANYCLVTILLVEYETSIKLTSPYSYNQLPLQQA